jgi:nucleotidyltransferase substrate binding protein (TIGR01987 family)
MKEHNTPDLRWKESLLTLERALNKLGDILQEPLTTHDYVLDATIQRFEFTIELFWKSLKHLLALKGVIVTFPKDCLQKAYADGWIDNEQLWLDMLEDRNLTSHTYKEEYAREIYAHIRLYYPEMKKVFDVLKTKFR